MTNSHHYHDVLIIGSGAAGLTLAARLDSSLRIAVLCKGILSEGSTYYAQGGVAAVMDDEDTIESHVDDTIIAGGGLCDENVIRFTAMHAREAIEWLVARGVDFTLEQKADGSTDFHLTREGGHSHRRILHAADATGRAVSRALTKSVCELPNVDLFEQHNAVDLIIQHRASASEKRCAGAYVLDSKTGLVKTFGARFVILATGGASKVYLYSTNPDVSSGDGIAMAWRAGCRVANMEFNQFHPTCLYHPTARSFLITEALRGEGGHLLLPDGTRFMPNFDERAELAPRDIVARAIDHEMKRLGIPCVYLNISHKPAEFIKNHFPTIHEKCLSLGIDITREPIPVVPAAHYTCGGVMTDLAGHTDIRGLYAIGEVAHTGLHGANRMASNSLLECVVFAAAAAANINQLQFKITMPTELPDWDESQVSDSDEEVVVSHNWSELRHFMWDYVGIVRTTKRLERAKRRIDLLKQEIYEYYSAFRITNDLLELRNLVCVADLIIRAALERKESRGLHFILDYPELLSEAVNTVLVPAGYLKSI